MIQKLQCCLSENDNVVHPEFWHDEEKLWNRGEKKPGSPLVGSGLRWVMRENIILSRIPTERNNVLPCLFRDDEVCFVKERLFCRQMLFFAANGNTPKANNSLPGTNTKSILLGWLRNVAPSNNFPSPIFSPMTISGYFLHFNCGYYGIFINPRSDWKKGVF